MFEFTIEYYFERYHTGEINTKDTREAVIYAHSKCGAIEKVKKVDNDYLCSKKISFSEINRRNSLIK